MAFDIITTRLAANVPNGGTFTVGYPVGRDAGAYALGVNHLVTSNPYGVLSRLNNRASFAFGASVVTITNSSGVTLDAGTEIRVQLDRAGDDDGVREYANPGKMAPAESLFITLGAPIAAAANNVCTTQALTAAALNANLNGAIVANGVAVFDVPRNVVAAWTNTAVLTVTGTDEYGNVVVESSASGTSMTGNKAFRTITRIRTSADITGLTVGTGTRLGLPVALPGTGQILRELTNGAAPGTAGTLVAADLAVATATTGDVRGTYAPNTAPNGTNTYQLVAVLGDAAFRGRPQFAG